MPWEQIKRLQRFFTGKTFLLFVLYVAPLKNKKLYSNSNLSLACASIFGLLDLVVSQGKYVGTTKAIIGMNFLAFLVTTCSIIVPFLLTIALGCMWFIPLNKKRRHRLRVTIEVLQGMQFLHIFWIY